MWTSVLREGVRNYALILLHHHIYHAIEAPTLQSIIRRRLLKKLGVSLIRILTNENHQKYVWIFFEPSSKKRKENCPAERILLIDTLNFRRIALHIFVCATSTWYDDKYKPENCDNVITTIP